MSTPCTQTRGQRKPRESNAYYVRAMTSTQALPTATPLNGLLGAARRHFIVAAFPCTVRPVRLGAAAVAIGVALRVGIRIALLVHIRGRRPSVVDAAAVARRRRRHCHGHRRLCQQAPAPRGVRAPHPTGLVRPVSRQRHVPHVRTRSSRRGEIEEIRVLVGRRRRRRRRSSSSSALLVGTTPDASTNARSFSSRSSRRRGSGCERCRCPCAK